MAVCVAVIGKDNGPLYFRSSSGPRQQGLGAKPAGQTSELQYHFIVSSALDIIEERVQTGHKSGLLSGVGPGAGNPGSPSDIATRELYLGALTAQEDYKVFGYMTNTKIKFVLVIEESSIPFRENDIRMMFRKIHGAFCDLMSNPFYSPGSEIKSATFDGIMTSILNTTSGSQQQ